MEVSGRRITDYASSDSIQSCDPCKRANEYVQGEYFCINCDDFLCSKCEKHHKTSRLSHGHSVLKDNEMPPHNLVWGEINICQKDKEKYRYFCPIHKQLCCSTCVVTEHGKCGAKSIKDEAFGYAYSQECKRSVENVKTLIEDLETINKELKATATDSVSEILADAEAFIEYLRSISTALQNSVKLQIENFDSKAGAATADWLEEGESLLKSLKEIHSYLGDIQKYNNYELLFIVMKLLEQSLKAHQNRIKEIQEQFNAMNIRGHRFVGNMELVDAITSAGSMECVQPEDQAKTYFSFEKRVKIKGKGDTAACWITGLAELDDDLVVLTDTNNQSVKLVDLEQGSISSQFKLPKQPWDISRMNYKQLVVSTDNQLLIININRRLVIDLERKIDIKTSGTCSGVQFCRGNFIVSILDHDPVLLILDSDGNALQSIPGPMKDFQFTTPLYIDTSHGFGGDYKIFVSDSDRDTIYCIDQNHEIAATYKDKRLKKPYGLATDGTGGLYAIGSGSNCIHHISSTFKEREICLDEEDEIVAPQTVAFCKKTKRLVISSNPLRAHSGADFLLVFK